MRVYVSAGFGVHFNHSSTPHCEHLKTTSVMDWAFQKMPVIVNSTLRDIKNTVMEGIAWNSILAEGDCDLDVLYAITSEFHFPRASHIMNIAFSAQTKVELVMCAVPDPPTIQCLEQDQEEREDANAGYTRKSFFVCPAWIVVAQDS